MQYRVAENIVRIPTERITLSSRFRNWLELITLIPRLFLLFASLVWMAVFHRKALRELADKGYL